jgi:hypothetical protein
MSEIIAFSREYRLAGVAIALASLTIAYVVFRFVRFRQRQRKQLAWQATRAEQDRIWNERVTNKPGDHPLG